MFKKDNDNEEKRPIVQLGRFEINTKDFGAAPYTKDLPIIATRNLVLFPDVTIPLSLSRESSLKIAKTASEKHIPVGIVCQEDPEEDDPKVNTGLYKYGVIADVYQVLDLPDGTHTALLHGRERFRILGKGDGSFVGNESVLSASVRMMRKARIVDQREFSAAVKQVYELLKELDDHNPMGEFGFTEGLSHLEDDLEAINFIATNMPADVSEKIEMLSAPNMNSRAMYVLSAMLNVKERVKVQRDVMEKAGQRMRDNQRSAYLQMQLDTIKDELYGEMPDEDEDYEQLNKRAESVGFPKAVREVFNKELNKLKRLHSNTPDYSVQYSYLETLLDLPWKKASRTTRDIAKARSILENDHYGLEKIMKRILEQIAVTINNPKVKSPILCFVGPPGVGKTSLGKSIAHAMGREYERVSLGGVHDEAEIRGHRRTYVGALPGRIMRAMKNSGVTNPVLLLDEVDKLGNDHKGDPGSALLEVLDPEQNCAFHDNYIDVDYDLSNVLFIATANTTSTIDPPLLDRMEVINLSGYLLEEKITIAHRHLIPKVLSAAGIDEMPFELNDDTLTALIDNYTAESGVRQLEKQLASLIRKSIYAKVNGNPFPSVLRAENLQDLLGLPLYNKDKYEGNEFPGVVTGLAWTQAGGEILLAEASLSPGKGDKLTITGNLGDVMKESATIALQWVKSHSKFLGIDPAMFDTNNLHIHFPEGAIPKDGPSAGITIATAIASIFTGRKVRERIAMTGEITLRGRVLPVGGIKEKILAAKRAGITTIILCDENKRNIEDIAEVYRAGLTFVYVHKVDEVMDFALL